MKLGAYVHVRGRYRGHRASAQIRAADASRTSQMLARVRCGQASVALQSRNLCLRVFHGVYLERGASFAAVFCAVSWAVWVRWAGLAATFSGTERCTRSRSLRVTVLIVRLQDTSASIRGVDEERTARRRWGRGPRVWAADRSSLRLSCALRLLGCCHGLLGCASLTGACRTEYAELRVPECRFNDMLPSYGTQHGEEGQERYQFYADEELVHHGRRCTAHNSSHLDNYGHDGYVTAMPTRHERTLGT